MNCINLTLLGRNSLKSKTQGLIAFLLSFRLEIDRDAHLAYLTDGLDPLPAAFVSLDANMPWICYWIIHSMDLLDYRIPETLASRVMNTLALCQHPNGGFGGGKNQEPHLACTYAAISALAIIGTQDAFQLIHRQALKDYLLSMKRRDGSFSMQLGGEADCRGSYCALASASLCGLLDEVSAGASQFIAACQTYEGGLGGVPYSEAHAGYTYCGFAALTILGSQDSIGLEQLADFARRSQCKVSGGFRGRTNKLVDGCYSFWTGALFPLLRKAIPDLAPFYSTGLQKYLLICAQDLGGGFKDKPEKYCDSLSITLTFLDRSTITTHATAWQGSQLPSTSQAHPFWAVRETD